MTTTDPDGFKRSPLLEDTGTRFYVITSNVGDNVVKSVQHNVWATQRKNEQKLNDAFRSSRCVILLFSVNKSGAFQGYARMRSLTGRASCRSDPFNGFGRIFDVEWLRLHDVEFADLQHVRNQLDDNRQVGFSRDGAELAHACGEELCRIIDMLVYREDPKSFEPASFDRERPREAAREQMLALPAPQASAATAAGAPDPATAAGYAAPPPGYHHASAPYYPHGPPPMHGHGYYPYGPAYPPPPWGAPHYPGGPPPHPSMAFGHPPAATAPPPGYFGGRHGVPHTLRKGKKDKKKKNRRRDDSSSSYSESEDRRKDKKKKKLKDKDKDGKRKEPEFEKMTYEEYVNWWSKKNKKNPGAQFPQGATGAPPWPHGAPPPTGAPPPPHVAAPPGMLGPGGGQPLASPKSEARILQTTGAWVPPAGPPPAQQEAPKKVAQMDKAARKTARRAKLLEGESPKKRRTKRALAAPVVAIIDLSDDDDMPATPAPTVMPTDVAPRAAAAPQAPGPGIREAPAPSTMAPGAMPSVEVKTHAPPGEGNAEEAASDRAEVASEASVGYEDAASEPEDATGVAPDVESNDGKDTVSFERSDDDLPDFSPSPLP